MPRSRGGFTLIEVLLALTLGAVTVLLAHAVFGAVAGGGRTLVMTRQRLDREMNARRWLAATFWSVETDSVARFEGRSTELAFTAWQQTASGWFVRRRISLGQAGERFVASVTPGDRITLADSVRDVAVDYLLEPGLNGRWVREWVSPTAPPFAIRVRLGRRVASSGESHTDTLLFLIGERG